MTLHRFKKIALLSALGIAAISMNVQAAERIALFPNWLAWDFLPAVATAHNKRVKSWALM